MNYVYYHERGTFKTIGKPYVFEHCRGMQKTYNVLGIVMIGNTAINGNSVDLDVYKMHHNDLVPYIEYYSFNWCADLGEYTGAISQLSKTTPANNPTAILNVIGLLPARGREQTHKI